MRLFIWELMCGGSFPDSEWDNSLAIEGRSMLHALLRDAARISGLNVAVIWDPRFDQMEIPVAKIARPESVVEAQQLFEEFVEWSDVTLLIAPEIDSVLTSQALLVEGIGRQLCGPNPAAIAQCSDKFLLADILTEAGVPCLSTFEFSVEHTTAEQLRFPCVVKPRDGAGSQETFLVQNAFEFARLQRLWARSSLLRQAIWQPYVAGRAVSVAVLISPEQYRYEPLPVCEQLLSNDGRFHYLGGSLPAADLDPVPIQKLAVDACRAVPGLRGYVGVDLIIPSDVNEGPLIVEINPRLTTSYLGYSHQCEQNILERWLNPLPAQPTLTWKTGRIRYAPDGTITSQDLKTESLLTE